MGDPTNDAYFSCFNIHNNHCLELQQS